LAITDLLLVLSSAFLHAWWSAAIKGSRDPLTFNLLQLFTPAAILVALLPWIDLGDVPPAAWRLLAATSIAHGGYFYWMSRAYEHGDLTLVYPISLCKSLSTSGVKTCRGLSTRMVLMCSSRNPAFRIIGRTLTKMWL